MFFDENLWQKSVPGCGFQVDDDHALFCNKCGFPFPQQRPARSVVVKGPVASTPSRESRAARPPRARPARRGSGVNAFLSFDSLITVNYLKLIYIIGAVLIILVSLVGITGGFAVKGEVPANMSFTNMSAVVQHSGSFRFSGSGSWFSGACSGGCSAALRLAVTVGRGRGGKRRGVSGGVGRRIRWRSMQNRVRKSRCDM